MSIRTILAIDPGNTKSAWVLFRDGKIIEKGIYANDDLAAELGHHFAFIEAEHLAVEMIASYGMAVGAEVFETCVWIGRFVQAWGGPHSLVYRKDVKLFLCGTTKAKDANIRQCLIDLHGPGKEAAIGTKKAPGPLYGVRADEWSALAVAITAESQLRAKQLAG